jgi:hypothetical protein
MADREFKIIITGDASGLQESSKDAAAALKDDLNPAVESFHKNWQAAAKDTEEFASKGELKHMVRELKRDFPELGLLARVAINPLVGGLGVLLGSLKAIDEIFKGIIERSNTGIFGGTFSRDMAAANKAAMDGEVAWRAEERALRGAGSAAQSMKDKTEALIDAIHQHHVAVVEQQNAEQAAALARVDMLEKEGKFTGPQAIQERLKIQDTFSRKKLLADIVAKDAELEAKRKEAEKLSRESQFEQQNAEEAKQQSEEANRDLERFEAQKTGKAKALAETQKQIKALSGTALLGPGQLTQLHTARALANQLETDLGANLTPERELELRDQAKQAAERYGNATKRAQELAGQASAISGKLPAEQALANQGYVDAGRTAATERLTRTYTATGQLAGQVQQMQEEINKNVEAGKGVMVTLLQKLKENSAVLLQLQKQVESLESPSRRTNHL